MIRGWREGLEVSEGEKERSGSRVVYKENDRWQKMDNEGSGG